MERKIFDLDGVPHVEAEEVRKLLRKRRIQFFEIPEGNFLGGGGLWVRSEEDFVEARRAIGAYQALLRSKPRTFERGPWYASIGRRLRARPRFALLLVFAFITLMWIMLPSRPPS